MPLYRCPNSPYWYVRIGRKTRRSTGTTDRAKAQEFERVLSERLWRREKLKDRSAVSWNEVTQRWLKDSSKARKRDRELIKWLAPKIAEHSVSDVADPDTLEELRQDALEAGWSHSTVDRLMGTVSAVLHAAKNWQWLPNVPAIPMYRPLGREPRWLTPDEFAALLRQLPPHLQLAAQFAVYSLLRMRAMLKLTWDRINLQERRAWIPRAHQKTQRTFGLALSKEAVRVLRELRKLNPHGDHVFQWMNRPIDDCNTQAFQEALRRAGIKGANWHTLRHTGASWAVQNGVTLPELMALGDWKDYRSVLKYAHLAPGNSATAAEKVAQMAHTGRSRKGRKVA